MTTIDRNYALRVSNARSESAVGAGAFETFVLGPLSCTDNVDSCAFANYTAPRDMGLHRPLLTGTMVDDVVRSRRENGKRMFSISELIFVY